MKKIITLLLILFITGCNSQEKNKQQTKSQENDSTSIKPKEAWDVKKEYDEQGNLIKYDSIYSWAYSNIKGDSLRVNLDSIMDSFKIYFGENRPIKWKEGFSYFPENDTIFMNDFFNHNFFYNKWDNQQNEIEGLLKKMDSSRNDFLKKYYPGLMESKGKN